MQEIIFGLIGGLGLFILGMKSLSEGLQKVAGTKLRRVLRSLTQNRWQGAGLGAFVTMVVQSSSITTVMLVGLINAGIINLIQGSSVIIGANIGTTITAQIIAFKVSHYALPMIGAGMAGMMIFRQKKGKFWAQVILALGLIFMGLDTMSGVMKPMKDVPAILDFFVLLATQPLYCILLGVVSTVLVQSSSASIGMVLALASVGLIDFNTSLYIILGDNIGTTITAWLASIGGSLSSKRLAAFHSLFNIIGTFYFAFLVGSGLYPSFVDWITPGAITTETIGRHIANGHTFFNVFNAILFLLVLTPTVKLVKWILPGEDVAVPAGLQYLQEELLSTPEIAIESAKKELRVMSDMVRSSVTTAIDGFLNSDTRTVSQVKAMETAIDHLQNDFTFYLAQLSSQELSEDVGTQLPPLLHSINDLERISDHAMNIAELTDRVASERLEFSDTAKEEMKLFYERIVELFDETVRALEFQDAAAIERAFFFEDQINKQQKAYLSEHTARLCRGQCNVMSALVFVDFINNLEKMADHLTNVAQASSSDFHFREPSDYLESVRPEPV